MVVFLADVLAHLPFGLQLVLLRLDVVGRHNALGVVNRAGQPGGTVGLAAPDWIVNGTVALLAPRWSLPVQGRFINSGLYDAQRIGPDDPRYATTLPNAISDNRVAGRFYVNLFGSLFVDPARRFEIFGSVNNLFNKACNGTTCGSKR